MAANLVRKYRDQATVDVEFARLKTEWQDYLGAIQVETPDDDMNTMMNVWNQYQTSVTFRFSRDASYYHGGLLFGRGYRDSCQDQMGPVMTRPDWVRQRILEMSTFQFQKGSVYHLYYPLSGGGEQTGHSDTPLWLPLSIAVYLKETGDFGLLEEVTPYTDDGEDSILQHLYGALDYVLDNLSERKLAKFRAGATGMTPSIIWAGKVAGKVCGYPFCLCYVLRETIELCHYIGEEQRANAYQKAYDTVAGALNELCWDGEWYIRGTNDLREIIGSHKNEEGKNFPQRPNLGSDEWGCQWGSGPSAA